MLPSTPDSQGLFLARTAKASKASLRRSHDLTISVHLALRLCNSPRLNDLANRSNEYLTSKSNHLTNCGGCGISPKVLLTVSPFSPSFAPQLDLFPCSLRALTPLSTAFTPNRSLTLLSTAFTQTHRGVGFSVPSVFRFFPHLFVTRFSNLPRLASLFRNRSLCFHILTNCFSRKPFIFTTIRIAREWGGHVHSHFGLLVPKPSPDLE